MLDELIAADQHLSDEPAVIVLLEAFGRGELNRSAAQAAVWHMNSKVSWQALAAKLSGTARSIVRNPYFTQAELNTAIAYATEAVRRAQMLEQPATDDSPSDSLSSY